MKILLNENIVVSEFKVDELKAILNKFTFQNPKYAEARKFNRSVRKIPQKLQMGELINGTLAIPIGALNYLKTFKPSIVDQRQVVKTSITFTGQLRPYQQRFIKKAIAQGGGQMVAATGSGKTVSGIALAAELQQRTLVLVKSKDLATQWIAAVRQFTGCKAGLIGNGKNTQGDEFTIGLTQSLIRWDRDDLAALNYGLIIADECHNLPANQAFAVINSINSKYKYGLSATPQRRDNLEFMIDLAVSPICSEITPQELTGAVLPVVVQRVDYDFYNEMDFEGWSDYISIISHASDRNQLIIGFADDFFSNESPTIILTSTIEHCEVLTALAADLDLEPLLIHGQLPAKVRRSRMAEAPEAMLVIGTLQLLSEGVDWPRFENLIFGSPVSAAIDKATPAATRLLQSIGRCRRPYPGKTHATVIDIVDRCGFGKSAWYKRSRIYEKQGFEVVR